MTYVLTDHNQISCILCSIILSEHVKEVCEIERKKRVMDCFVSCFCQPRERTHVLECSRLLQHSHKTIHRHPHGYVAGRVEPQFSIFKGRSSYFDVYFGLCFSGKRGQGLEKRYFDTPFVCVPQVYRCQRNKASEGWVIIPTGNESISYHFNLFIEPYTQSW